MKKLMTFCFIILFSVLSALSCFNFAFDALDRIERDKITIVIEKPSNISATDFLGRDRPCNRRTPHGHHVAPCGE